jgi:hypothetical protein
VRIIEDAELGLDVDTPHHLAICRAALAARGQGPDGTGG